MSQGPSIDDMFYGTVTVGERGQIVIPAEARTEYGIMPGEKLLIFGQPHHAGLMVVKMSGLAEFIEVITRALALAENDNSEPDNSEEPSQGGELK